MHWKTTENYAEVNVTGHKKCICSKMLTFKFSYNLYLNFAVNILKNVFLIKDHCKYVKLNS